MSPLSVAVVFGTRPEAIKLAPVVRELRRRPRRFRTWVVATAQHRELLDLVIDEFGLVPDFDLDLMRPGQSPPQIAASLLNRLEELWKEIRPQWVVLQGDTTTTLSAALSAFWAGVRICHVEAGLRSGERRVPFPEEMHRRLVTPLADLHCAPTPRACQNLIAEGVPPDSIVLTGNPIVDALRWIESQQSDEDAHQLSQLTAHRPFLLITVHRRENQSSRLRRIIEAVERIAEDRPDLHILWPVHPNPRVAQPLWQAFHAHPRIHLIDPQPYRIFVGLLRQAQLVLTDSGGIQEEAAVLGRPVLVLREVTERPEAVECGAATLVGTDPESIQRHVNRALNQLQTPTSDAGPLPPSSVFGDGRAAQRIATALAHADRKHSPKPISTAR